MSKKESKELKDQELENNESSQEEMLNTDVDENNEGDGADNVSELDELKSKLQESNDKFLRLYSEFDNFRKRTTKERLELFKTAGEDIFVALLPILDDFERAVKNSSEQDDAKSVLEGMQLIHNKLLNTLENKGLKPMDSPVGEEFDVDHHEAISRVPAPEKKMKGKVIDEVERGYYLNDKVIRYTKVVIGE